MADGKYFISQKSVRQALDSMLLGRKSEPPNPLESLILVDDLLSDPAFPDLEYPREFAVRNLLLRLIAERLTRHRHDFSFNEIDIHESRKDAIHAIEHDTQQQFPDLIGWSVLYYRYGRADLNITLADYRDVTHVDARTLRRYQESAIKRLADIIAHREWVTRQEKQKLFLYSQLPGAMGEMLVGRDQLLAQTFQFFESNSPRHIQITGPTGIGKTAFAQAVLHSLIDSGNVDRLVWLTRPHSAQFIQQHLQETLIKGAQISLKEYALLHRLAVVLDDINMSDDELSILQATFDMLGDALVVITNKVFMSLSAKFKHIVLPELSRQDVHEIVKVTRNQDDPHILRDFSEELWQLVGGNPLAVKTGANNLSNLESIQPLFVHGDDVIYQMLLSTYQALTGKPQQTLFMFALMPAIPITATGPSRVWVKCDVADGDIIALLSCGLLTQSSSDSYLLADVAQRFVRWLYGRDANVRSQFTQLLNTLDYTSASLEVVEHILLQDWLEIDTEHRVKLAMLTVADGIRNGHYSAWGEILSTITTDSPLKLYHAMCLRRLADFPRAEALLHEIIRVSGQSGDFLQQGRGLLELGILLRQQGLYGQALEYIERSKAIALTHANDDLLRKSDLELVQIALDSGEIDQARAAISHLVASSEDNPVILLLLAEIHLILKAYHRGKTYAEMALQHAQSGNLGRVYALLGRIAVEEEDFNSAQDWLDLAISTLQHEADWYALARAKSNLAANLIRQRQFLDDAHALLQHAQKIQETLSDRAGLIHTLHNFEILRAIRPFDGI